jgi:hypothetical protein
MLKVRPLLSVESTEAEVGKAAPFEYAQEMLPAFCTKTQGSVDPPGLGGNGWIFPVESMYPKKAMALVLVALFPHVAGTTMYAPYD